MLRALCCAGVLLLATSACAADGDVDLSFGDEGQVTIARPPGAPTSPTPTGDAIALADGRIVWTQANEDSSVWVGRNLHDGSADTTFGDANGRVTLGACADFAPTFLMPDDADGGAIVWTGACLVHVLEDGSIDAAFGGVPLIADDLFIADAARDGAGRFVLAGMVGRTWTLLRVEADGATPDAGFGDAGFVTIEVPATNDLRGLNAIAIRDDDRIAVAGWRGNTHGPNLVVAQLAADGTPDPAWNGGALVDLDPPDGQAGISATALAIDGDGSLVVGGIDYSGRVGCCLLLTRLDAAGAIVAGFGLRIYDFGNVGIGSFFEGRDAVAIRPDGRILLATTLFPFSADHRTQFGLMRAEAGGGIDAAFGEGGWRGYAIADPSGTGQSGDYVQLHAIATEPGSVLMFGRTFFEDNSNGLDYVSMVRTVFAAPDTIFASGFEA